MARTIFSLILALGLGTTGVVYSATELARVNSKVITLEEFNRQYRENRKFFQYKTPTKQTVLEEMIRRDLGIQEAKKLGLDRDPEVIEKINTVLYHSLLDKKLAGQFKAIDVSNTEAEEFYKKNPEIRTSHIFVQVRSDATRAQENAALDRMRKIQGELNDGLKSGKVTFAEISGTYSDGVAGSTKGDIDYQTKDKLDPAYYAAALKLKIGEISPIIRSQFGYHIIKLTGMKDIKDVDRGQIKRMVYDEKRNKLFEAYMDELKKKAKVSVNSALLKE